MIGDCSLKVSVASAVRHLEKVPLTCEIENWTNKKIKSLTVKLVQVKSAPPFMLFVCVNLNRFADLWREFVGQKQKKS